MSDYLGGVINGINDKTEEAFKYLYNTFYASLCRYANRFVGEFMDEEDVVQEILKICGPCRLIFIAPYIMLVWYIFGIKRKNGRKNLFSIWEK